MKVDEFLNQTAVLTEWPVFEEKSTAHLSWTYSAVTELTDEQLVRFCLAVPVLLDLPADLNLPFAPWQQLIRKIQEIMNKHPNSYHTFRHVVDVMQTCCVYMTQFKAADHFNKLDLFCLVTAAIAHDVDHPGTNNLYQVNAETPLALLYNDCSVLENHHCCTLFSLTQHNEFNIFASMESVDKTYCRKVIINMIMATDMSHHFSLIKELESCVSREVTGVITPTPTSVTSSSSTPSGASPPTTVFFNKDTNSRKTVVLADADKTTLLKCLLHAADISNPTKPWAVSYFWATRVIGEFHAQGDRELLEHLPQSPNTSRESTMLDELGINFIDFIVAPYNMMLVQCFPALACACEEVLLNREKWCSLYKERVGKDGDGTKFDSRGADLQGKVKNIMDKLIKV